MSTIGAVSRSNPRTTSSANNRVRTPGDPVELRSCRSMRPAYGAKMPDLVDLLHDLDNEHSALDALLVAVPETGWELPTPSEPWAVRDQVAHLLFFDAVARLALTEPDGFAGELAAAVAGYDGYLEAPLRARRAVPPAELLAEWRTGRRSLLAALTVADPAARVPWYGPSIGAGLLRDRPADGNVGPRSGRGGRGRCRAAANRPAASHRRPGGPGASVQLRSARPAGADGPGPGGAGRARWRMVGLGRGVGGCRPGAGT